MLQLPDIYVYNFDIFMSKVMNTETQAHKILLGDLTAPRTPCVKIQFCKPVSEEHSWSI